jgi:5-methyltetrahydropteroyltriglutamate--homocysteine methyltransferase
VTGTTCVHICFGYAAVIHVRPSGYSFLPELAQCSCKQVSIETAQSHLDCSSVLRALEGKRDDGGLPRLCPTAGRGNSRTIVADRIRRALEHVKPEQVILAPDCGMKYLPRDAATAKLRAMVEAAKVLRREHAA